MEERRVSLALNLIRKEVKTVKGISKVLFLSLAVVFLMSLSAHATLIDAGGSLPDRHSGASERDLRPVASRA